MRKIFLLGSFLSFYCGLSAQSTHDSLRTEVGYLIYMRPNWIFQPCLDSSIYVLAAIDHRSFVPGTFSYSFGVNLLPLEGFGRKIFLKYFDNLEKRNIIDTVYSFYCTIKLNISADTSMNKVMDSCWYRLSYKNREFDLCCYYFLNAIDTIEPWEEEYKKIYLLYLKEENYPLPDWSKKY